MSITGRLKSVYWVVIDGMKPSNREQFRAEITARQRMKPFTGSVRKRMRWNTEVSPLYLEVDSKDPLQS